MGCTSTLNSLSLGDTLKKNPEAVAAMLVFGEIRVRNAINNYLDAAHPKAVLSKEESKHSSGTPSKSDKFTMRRNLDRAQRDLHEMGSLFLKQAGFTTTGLQPKSKTKK